MTEPTAPDTTGGELLARLGYLHDPQLVAALRDLLSERDKLAAQVQAAREVHPRHRISDFDEPCAMCRALDTLP